MVALFSALVTLAVTLFVLRGVFRTLLRGRRRPGPQTDFAAQLRRTKLAAEGRVAEAARRAALVEDEQTRPCALIRRQVPARADATSWLGGLPRMPADLPWPERGGKPLNFLMQIDLSALPAELWGGLGPRSGWLLVFLDPLFEDVPEEGDGFAILHIEKMGPERPAPAGLGPIDWDFQIEHMTAPGWPQPVQWRRWPVDLIPHAQRYDPEGLQIPPDRFWPDVTLPPKPEEEETVLLAGVARLAIDQALARLDAQERGRPATPDPQTLLRMLEAEAEAARDKLAKAEANLARMDAYLAERKGAPDAVRREAQIKRDIPQKALDWLAPRMTPQGVQGLAAELSAHEDAIADWARRLRAALGEIRAQLSGLAPADPAPEAAARRLNGLPREIPTPRPPEVQHFHNAPWMPRKPSTARAAPRTGPLQREALRDAAATPGGLDALPPSLRRAALEQALRCGEGIHRMGGWRDPLQDGPAPTDPPLLLQICSDDAMGWCWGDVGAFWLSISPEDLRAGELGRIRVAFECH